MATATNPKVVKLQAPDYLDTNEADKFRELVLLLGTRHAKPKPEDVDALANYCQAFVTRQKAVAELESEPLILTGPNGSEYTNPRLKVIGQMDKQLLAIGKLFGLDPKSRHDGQDTEAAARKFAFDNDDLSGDDEDI